MCRDIGNTSILRFMGWFASLRLFCDDKKIEVTVPSCFLSAKGASGVYAGDALAKLMDVGQVLAQLDDPLFRLGSASFYDSTHLTPAHSNTFAKISACSIASSRA